MTIRPLLYLSILLIISSCDKVFSIPFPVQSNKVVLSLFLNKDSVIVGRVSLSGERPFRYSAVQEIKDAVVNLYENGTFRETLTRYDTFGLTFYRGNTLPRAGATYQVTAVVPGYSEVSGSDYIPDTVKIGEMRMTVAQANNSRSNVTINLQLHDDAAVQNFYRIRIYHVSESLNPDGTVGRQQKGLMDFETDDTEWGVFGNKARKEFYTTDALFNGRSVRLTFRTTNIGQFKKMIIEVSSLTYGSYNYLNSTYMSQENNDDPLSEKVIVYNNIENGLGIVGGVAQREYDLVR
ncbi:MAG TPA: DUF4249 domain-containing protein [Niastella sp.]